MHWSEATSDALAALHTLLLKGGWDCIGRNIKFYISCQQQFHNNEGENYEVPVLDLH